MIGVIDGDTRSLDCNIVHIHVCKPYKRLNYRMPL